MESLAFQVAVGIGSALAGYAILRHTVSEHGVAINEMEKHSSDMKDEILRHINAGFKRLDHATERITILEQNTKEYLGLREAEDKFVSHKELQLHIANIENTLKQMEKESMSQSKKLDYLTELLPTNSVKSITPHGAVFGGNND